MSGGILTLSVETRQRAEGRRQRAEGRGQKGRSNVARKKDIKDITVISTDMISFVIRPSSFVLC
jgi:hypothetical protein